MEVYSTGSGGGTIRKDFIRKVWDSVKTTFGRFYQGESVIHLLDPRMKLVLCLFYMVVSLLLSSFAGIAGFAVLIVIVFLLSKIPVRVVLSSIRGVIILLAMIFILNIFSNRTGNVIFSVWIIVITQEGVKQAFLLSMRLLLLLVSTNLLLTLTTTPLLLSDSLESLFSPLKRFRFPVHELAMILSISLRFIPLLMEETDKIMKAQTSRGANYDSGGLLLRIKGYVTILVPLFISAFKHAIDLADAMEARCYHGGEGRTKLRILRATGKDWCIFILLTFGLLIVLGVNVLI